MKLVKPSVELLDQNKLGESLIEIAGRTCYKSEDKITNDSHIEFIERLTERRHDAMLEFGFLAMKFVCDRGVTHEIVRHRLFSYAQESTRYCNYKGGVKFIIPPWIVLHGDKVLNTDVNISGKHLRFTDGSDQGVEYAADAVQWFHAIQSCEYAYQKLILEGGWNPQQARSVLPNSLKTEICLAGNLREWKHFFKLRTASTAHPQIQEVANMALVIARKAMPTVFNIID